MTPTQEQVELAAKALAKHRGGSDVTDGTREDTAVVISAFAAELETRLTCARDLARSWAEGDTPQAHDFSIMMDAFESTLSILRGRPTTRTELAEAAMTMLHRPSVEDVEAIIMVVSPTIRADERERVIHEWKNVTTTYEAEFRAGISSGIADLARHARGFHGRIRRQTMHSIAEKIRKGEI